MKMFAWVSSLICIGLLTGCGDSADQTSMRSAELAVSKMAAVQAALDQVIDARDAIKKADNDKLLALKEAEQKREAVRQAIAMATKESEALKKDAAMRKRWAQKTHDQAVATRKLLLKAAMEQSDAKALLIEKEKALMKIRTLDDLHQNDAKVAMLGQLKAEKMLAVVIEAERLASLSIDLVAPNSAAGIQKQTKNEKTVSPKTTASTKTKPVKIAKISPSYSSKSARQQVAKTSPKSNLKQATTNTTGMKLSKTSPPSTSKADKQQPPQKTSPKNNVQLATTNTHADAQRGHALAQKCQRCHNFEPNQKKKFGPNLFGVVGQQDGKSQDYKYGAALANANFTWDEEKLTDWICHSGKSIKKLTGKRYATTKMTPQRICGQDARDVVAFLRTLKAQASVKAHSDS